MSFEELFSLDFTSSTYEKKQKSLRYDDQDSLEVVLSMKNATKTYLIFWLNNVLYLLLGESLGFQRGAISTSRSRQAFLGTAEASLQRGSGDCDSYLHRAIRNCLLWEVGNLNSSGFILVTGWENLRPR
jgi:hypothetical protein